MTVIFSKSNIRWYPQAKYLEQPSLGMVNIRTVDPDKGGYSADEVSEAVAFLYSDAAKAAGITSVNPWVFYFVGYKDAKPAAKAKDGTYPPKPPVSIQLLAERVKTAQSIELIVGRRGPQIKMVGPEGDAPSKAKAKAAFFGK